MNLDLFNNNENTNDNFITKFIEELKEALENIISIVKKEDTSIEFMEEEEENTEEMTVDEKYDLYEIRKVYLDNISHNGNDLAWITDENSVCISRHGDYGVISADEIELLKNAKVGEVYEKIDGKYVLNMDLTIAINNITLDT